MKKKASFTLELTSEAEKVYVRLYGEAQACIEAGDSTNAKVTRFNMVEEVLEKIIPHDPFARERGLSAPLSNLYRVKKGRIRVCDAASSRKGHIVVLYISDTPRKDGDVNDPYAILTRMVLSGRFDAVLEKLGVRLPSRSRKSFAPDSLTLHKQSTQP